MDMNNIEKIGRTSKRTAVMTAVAAAAIVIGLIFSLLGTLKSHNEAVKIEALNNKLKESEQYLSNGIEFAGRGRLTAAISSYNKAIELNPNSATAYQLLGYALLRRSQKNPRLYPNDLKDSISDLEKAVQLDPNHIWAHYNLALTYWAAGKKELAIDMVRRVLELDPSFRDVIAKDGQFQHFRESPEFRKLMNLP